MPILKKLTLLAMSPRRPIPKTYAVIGEYVIVNKPEFHMHNRLGEIWKVWTDGDQQRISVSFDGEIYNFYQDELVLA